jgi:hypothetical protein
MKLPYPALAAGVRFFHPLAILCADKKDALSG